MIKRLLLVIAFIFIVGNAYALEFEASGLKVQFYGELHMGGFYVNSNNAMTSNSEITGVGNDVTDSFDIAVYNFSRFGANLIFGDFSGVIELQPDLEDGIISIFRRFYVQYNFSNGSNLAMGKDWTPVGYSYNQYANEYQGLWGYGTLWELRLPQIRYTIAGFQIAVIYADGTTGTENMAFQAPDGTESAKSIKSTQVIPRFEASFTDEFENLSYKIYAGYGRYTAKLTFDVNGNNVNKNAVADTFVFGLGAQYDIGGFFISGTSFIGQNLDIYGALQYSALRPVYNFNNQKVTPMMSVGVAGNVGYNLNDNIQFSLGAGYTRSSDNSFKTSQVDEQFSAFFNIPIIVAKYLTVIPEVSYFDEMKDFSGAYQGSAMYYGVYLLAQF